MFHIKNIEDHVTDSTKQLKITATSRLQGSQVIDLTCLACCIISFRLLYIHISEFPFRIRHSTRTSN
jgi:hypothetical protein